LSRLLRDNLFLRYGNVFYCIDSAGEDQSAGIEMEIMDAGKISMPGSIKITGTYHIDPSVLVATGTGK
jgi:hypothetical protein